MNDTRIRTTIAPNLVCCDGPWAAYQSSEGGYVPQIVWEAPSGPQDRRPTFAEAVNRFRGGTSGVTLRALCRGAGITQMDSIYTTYNCTRVPRREQRKQMAALIHMAPEAIRWPVRITESEANDVTH